MYFSLRSPYSWLAHHDLTERAPALLERLTRVPFWEPDEHTARLLAEAGGEFPYVTMSRAKHLYVLHDVALQAKARKLAVRWPVDRAPHWEVCHLAYLVAERRGRGLAFIELAYRARWIEGRDICAPAVVADIAGAAGADPAECVAALEDPAVRAEGVAALLSAHDTGVFGVPFFVTGYRKFWGVDRLPGFFDALGEGSGPGPVGGAPAAAGARGADHGHAGGCG